MLIAQFMRFLLTIAIFVCFITNSFTQSNNDFTPMLQEAESILYTQPQESLKIAEHLIQNSKDTPQRIQAYLLSAGSYYAMGEFDNAIKANIDAKKLAEAIDDNELQIKIGISSILLLNQLGMNIVAEEYYLRIKVLATESKNEKTLNYLDGGIALIQAYKYFVNDNPSEALNSLKIANTSFEKIPDQILKNETAAAIVETYLATVPLDSAQAYFQSSLQNTIGEHPNRFIKMLTLNQLGRLYFLKKEYTNSLTSYQTAIEISKQFNNKPYQSKIMEGLSTTYLALDEVSLFYSNRTESGQVAKEVETEENKAVNSIYNYINDNNTDRRDTVKKTYQRNLSILSGILTLILLTWMALRYRYKNRARQYENFINYFENKLRPQEIVPIKETPKSLNIPKETEDALIQKLRQFENSKQFTKQDMSLALLASNFDTNTKYLSEIINTHKNKNFNSYINELRINYIIDKLKNNSTYLQYKISYLAEESGFSSHSSFATVFKAVTGIPPTVFIDLLRTQKTTSKALTEKYEEV